MEITNIASRHEQAKANHSVGLRDLPGVSITYLKKNGLFSCLSGVKNTYLEITFAGRKVQINYDNVVSQIKKAIAEANKGAEAEWIKQEQVTCPSATVNKQIDNFSLKKHQSINKESKAEIFRRASLRVTPGLELDPRCAQSSLTHALNSNKYLNQKLQKLTANLQNREKKNKLNNIIKSELTDRIYENEYNGMNLNSLRKEVEKYIYKVISHHVEKK